MGQTLVGTQMGRPRKGIDRMSVRIDVKAIAMCRKAAAATGEPVVDYMSRVLMDQATKDVEADAERTLAEKVSRKASEADPKLMKGKGDN